ncbi:MAG: hypothetical protein IPI82_09305 [Candidatus Microthrix sp.]|nr:hypothetical protein [Candidatus Microthrix sp.]MBK7322629.1 hypothetical protein [Candidatus Microthrix sp.]
MHSLRGLWRSDQVSLQAALSVLDDEDPDALMELLGSMHRAPEIRNTDGHEMEPTEVTWSLPDGADVAGALGRAGLTDDGDSWTLVRDTANQSNALVASIQLDGDDVGQHQLGRSGPRTPGVDRRARSGCGPPQYQKR